MKINCVLIPSNTVVGELLTELSVENEENNMKNSIKFILGLSVILLMVSAGPAYAQDLSGKLVISGSSTVFPVMEEASLRWEELHPDVILEVSSVGSGGGFDALSQDQADIAPMSRPPKDSELNSVDFTVEQETIGLDALAVIVHNDNPLENIDHPTLRGIYNGTYTQWDEVADAMGVDVTFDFATNDIKVHERDENSGTHDYFNEEILGEDSGGNTREVDSSKLAGYGQYNAQSDLNNAVANTENGIGYGGLAYVDDSVKVLTYEGTEATKANAADGSYGLARPLFLVWNGDDSNDLRDEFLDYIMSPEGQYIVAKVGYVAVEDAADSYTPVEEAPVPIIASLLGLLAIAAIPVITRRKFK